MAILVTGAAGFVGNNVTRRLVEQGKSVRALVRNPEKASLRLGDIENQIEIVEGDVTDRSSLKSLMKDITAVVHTVAVSMEKGEATYDEVNYQGTINIVDAAEAGGVTRFINMSQNGAAADHWSRFLRSKGKAQAYIASSKLQWTAFRPSAIFGPQDEFFNSIARLAALTPLVFPNIGGGKAQFQPVSIDDVVTAVVRSLDDDKTIGREFSLGGPEVLTLEEITKRILKAKGSTRGLVPAPTGLLKIPVAIMQTVLPGSPVNTTLLDLLKEPNIISENALITYFKVMPSSFSGENIAYLKNATIGAASRRIFTNATVT